MAGGSPRRRVGLYLPGMRILLVEDDSQLRASIARGLTEAGYDVAQAGDGPAAVELASSGAYDAIVLDVLLPGMDGIEVCRALRDREDRVPILMLTALDAVEHRIQGLDAGADDYLPKPFDFGELLARLRALTRRHGDGTETELRVSDLVVDLRRRSVRRGARAIPVTGREFAFIAYMARNSGRVVTRAELAQHVWDEGQTQSNVIDVYASRLRRKLDADGEPPLLSTLRGVGYLLEAPDGA